MPRESSSKDHTRKRSTEMGSSSRSHSARHSSMDHSSKDHLGGSLQDSYHYSTRRNPAMEEIMSPKRILGKKMDSENQGDGIFRKPTASKSFMGKLPFLSASTSKKR